ncbi:MAG: hypothetical protein JO290_02345, partial [Sphingomonadaceae bacterium]|nr:hypothetical protein [Sphingomonadaceae bacterium]
GDPDEALDQAEALLRDRALSSYYDEVAVKGLNLAAADCMRGVLDDARLERVRRASLALIEDLAGYADTTPTPSRSGPAGVRGLAEKALPADAAPDTAAHPPSPAWRANGAVLCVAGRDPLDGVGARILAQLLDKHGLGTRVANCMEVSREQIASLNVSGVLAVAVVYLEVEGVPAHLRTLLRRLHDRLPGVPVVVGLWHAAPGSSELPDADVCVGTLREAIARCRDIADAAGAADRELLAAFG